MPRSPRTKFLATTEESRASDVMPWEQFDGAPPSHETPPPTSSNPVIESLDVPDVLIDPAPVGLASQELEIPPSESTGPILEADSLGRICCPRCRTCRVWRGRRLSFQYWPSRRFRRVDIVMMGWGIRLSNVRPLWVRDLPLAPQRSAQRTLRSPSRLPSDRRDYPLPCPGSR